MDPKVVRIVALGLIALGVLKMVKSAPPASEGPSFLKGGGGEQRFVEDLVGVPPELVGGPSIPNPRIETGGGLSRASIPPAPDGIVQLSNTGKLYSNADSVLAVADRGLNMAPIEAMQPKSVSSDVNVDKLMPSAEAASHIEGVRHVPTFTGDDLNAAHQHNSMAGFLQPEITRDGSKKIGMVTNPLLEGLYPRALSVTASKSADVLGQEVLFNDTSTRYS